MADAFFLMMNIFSNRNSISIINTEIKLRSKWWPLWELEHYHWVSNKSLRRSRSSHQSGATRGETWPSPRWAPEPQESSPTFSDTAKPYWTFLIVVQTTATRCSLSAGNTQFTMEECLQVRKQYINSYRVKTCLVCPPALPTHIWNKTVRKIKRGWHILPYNGGEYNGGNHSASSDFRVMSIFNISMTFRQFSRHNSNDN